MTTEASSASEGSDQDPVIPEADKSADDGVASDAPAEGAQTDVKDPASSSPADGKDPEGGDDQSPTTMVDAVTAVLDKAKEGADPSPAESGQEKVADADAAGGEKPAATEAEVVEADKLLPFHDHPRFRELIAERNDLKGKLETASEAEEAITRVEGVLKEQNLSVDEFNRTLVLAGLVKNDPARALEAIEPLYNRLREVTGNTLPKDIHDQVQQGFMTEDAGLELAKARAQAKVAEFREQTQTYRATQEREQQQTQQVVEGVSNAATEWENKWKASDPDYTVKAQRVLDKIELLARRGAFPTDPVKVSATCDAVRKEVEVELRSLLPKRAAVTPNKATGTTGQGSTAPKIASYEDAVLAAIS